MRENIFRGKRRYGKGWAYGSLIATMDGNYCCILEAEDDVHPTDYPYLDGDIGWIDGQATPVIPETVGQYTGMVDMNGKQKKIFEGDIVEIKGYSGYYEVKYDFGQFFVGINTPLAYKRFDCFVVGNIHDNPELLEAK